MKKGGGILALSLAAVVACDPASLPPTEPAGALGFVVHPGATQYPSPDSPAPLFGDGLPGNGNRVPASWLGADACTRLVLGPVPDGGPKQAAAAFGATAAVAGPDGSVIGLGQEGFSRRDRSGEVVRLFRSEPGRNAVALVRAGRDP
ncbi:hypothetical protein ACIOD2_30795 [Amycolatopsis sp. NPDC088138]|uniref:hypothetical protein n=1 Tax=Amycolatopsis sp. NPDC088138 TaxID=3363938 RepID=UPI003802ED3B